jgi:MHS family proline/betaine transporter-like MFS transporter
MSRLPTMDTRSRRLLSIVLLANVLEGYEASIFITLTGFISPLFFSPTLAQSSLPLVECIKGLLPFSMSYLMYLLGGIFFDRMEDGSGNARVLRVSLLLLSIPTALICFLPTYARDGVIATLLLLSLQYVKGFVMADKRLNSVSAGYVFKNIKQHDPGLFWMSGIIGMLLGFSTIYFWLNVYFDQAAILAWAWRIPFMLSIPLSMFIVSIAPKALIQL